VLGEVPLDGVAVLEAADEEAVGVCAALGVEPPHAARTNMETRAAPLARTR